MKDRSMRRHQDFRAKVRSRKTYNSCLGHLSTLEKDQLENNIEKLKKVCVASHLERPSKKEHKKSLREMKHDITMREQMSINWVN